MSTYFPLAQPIFEATVPASFARDWEIFVRPRGGSEADQITVYAAGEDGAAVLPQPLITGPAGRIGEGDQFGWVKGSDLPVDLWGRPKGSTAGWQVLPEGDQASVVGGASLELGEQTKALLEESALGTSLFDPVTETWEPRPEEFKRVIFVSPVHGAPDPPDAQDVDEKVEPREKGEGGGAGVESVNGHAGVVVLTAEDVSAQPLDSDLTAIASLSTTSFGRSLLTQAGESATRTALGLGTAATQASSAFDAAGAAAAAQSASQPLDSDLTAIAALATTTFGRSLLTMASASATRTALELGTAALKASGEFDASGAAAAAQAASQPLDSDLTAIAALTTATFGRELLTKANAAAVRTTIEAQQSLGFTPENVANKSTSGSLGASDELYPSQKAVKTYVDGLLAASDAVVYKGAKDCSASPNFPAAEAGHLYAVSVAGKIGGSSGVEVEAGDMFICKVDGTAEGNQATVGANWNVIQTNIVGAVTGPSSATTGRIATFNGTSGKVVQDGGSLISDLVAKSLVTTKGDLVAASGSATPVRHAVGADGKILAAASGESDGLKWIANEDIDVYTFSIAAPEASKVIGGFFLRLASGQAAKLKGVLCVTTSGTAKFKLKRKIWESTTSEPLKEKEAKSTAQELTPSSETLADKDFIQLETETVSSPANLVITVMIERTRS